MPKIYRLILFILLLFWCSGIFFVCIANYFESLLQFVPIIKNGYSIVCHQNPEKLISFGCGENFTCSRCTGIYFGALLIAFVFLFHEFKFSPDKKTLFLLTLPMLIDVIFTSINIYPYSKLAAFVTGFLFGSIVFVYFYNGLYLLFRELKKR